MDFVWLVAIPLLTAFLIGSLPLGAWLVRSTSGFDPREVNPHLLGVETVARLVGSWVALGSFAIDMLKGAVGMIAGTLGIGVGRWLGNLGAQHDGTVAVEETRCEGLADHLCLRASHTGLLLSRAAARQTAHFLQCGRFQAHP